VFSSPDVFLGRLAMTVDMALAYVKSVLDQYGLTPLVVVSVLITVILGFLSGITGRRSGG
jgi:hypothetical protein